MPSLCPSTEEIKVPIMQELNSMVGEMKRKMEGKVVSVELRVSTFMHTYFKENLPSKEVINYLNVGSLSVIEDKVLPKHLGVLVEHIFDNPIPKHKLIRFEFAK